MPQKKDRVLHGPTHLSLLLDIGADTLASGPQFERVYCWIRLRYTENQNETIAHSALCAAAAAAAPDLLHLPDTAGRGTRWAWTWGRLIWWPLRWLAQ